MGNSKGSADSVVGDGQILTELYLAPADEPVLVATVNMPSVAGASMVSIVYTPRIRWAFLFARDDPYATVTLTIDGVSGETVQTITQYPRNNRHREDMKKFLEELALLRAKSEKKEDKKDGRRSKQSNTTEKVPGGDSGVLNRDNEGGDGPGEAEVPAVNHRPTTTGHEAD